MLLQPVWAEVDQIIEYWAAGAAPPPSQAYSYPSASEPPPESHSSGWYASSSSHVSQQPPPPSSQPPHRAASAAPGHGAPPPPPHPWVELPIYYNTVRPVPRRARAGRAAPSLPGASQVTGNLSWNRPRLVVMAGDREV